MQRQTVSDVITGLVVVSAVLVWARPNSKGPTLVEDFANLFTNSIVGIIGDKGGSKTEMVSQSVVDAAVSAAKETQGSIDNRSPSQLFDSVPENATQPFIAGQAPQGTSFTKPGPGWAFSPQAPVDKSGVLRALGPDGSQIGWWIPPA